MKKTRPMKSAVLTHLQWLNISVLTFVVPMEKLFGAKSEDRKAIPKSFHVSSRMVCLQNRGCDWKRQPCFFNEENDHHQQSFFGFQPSIRFHHFFSQSLDTHDIFITKHHLEDLQNCDWGLKNNSKL